MSFVGDVFDSLTGKTEKEAAQASGAATDASVAAQQAQLDYLKQINALPTELRDAALQKYGGFLGLEGFDKVDLTAGAATDPLYQAQLANIGNMKQGAIDTSMSTASATGGLRGGNLQQGFADISEQEQLAKNQALAQYQQGQLSGLGGLMGVDTGQNQIANVMGNIGQTQAQGIMGQYNSAQGASQAGFNNLMGLGQLGLGAFAAFSDRQLKTNIKRVGEENGFTKYSWDWNELANEIGLTGSDTGHMADEVEVVYPDLVTVDNNTGYKQINYGALQNG